MNFFLKTLTSIFLFLMMIHLSSCLKTTEQLKREKKIDSMSNQLGDTQGLLADIVAQLRGLQEQVNQLNGRMEEWEYHKTNSQSEKWAKIEEDQKLLLEQNQIDKDVMLNIQKELKEQRDFLAKVTQSLEKLNQSPSSQKISHKTLLKKGLKLVTGKSYKQAKELLEPLLTSKSLTAGEKNKVLHGLGKIAYFTSQHDEAITYFSKIFTKYPRSSLAPSSLLFIGRSLKKMGKKNEAVEAFNQVISNYKETSEANEAKKEI